MDTAGPVIGVALLVGDEVRCRTERIQRGAEARLAPWLEALCQEAGIGLGDLDGIGVAAGPGAFTGLRVGLATAAGLALACGVPLWQGNSLESRALRVGEGRVLSMLDARKERVYAAAWEDGQPLGEPGDVSPLEAVGRVRAPFIATGEGAVVYERVIHEAGGTVWPDAEHPAVDSLARLTAQAIGRGEGTTPLNVQPVYLRAPDAQRRVHE